MHLESEEEVTIYCEENEDTEICAYEDYETKLDYNLINIGDFVLANVSSSVNNKKVACIFFFFLEKEDKCYVSFSKVLRRLDLRPVTAQRHEVWLYSRLVVGSISTRGDEIFT